MTYDSILYSVRNGVATIEHNRPHARNAENRQLLDELDAATSRADKDPAVRVIVIGGTGDHFSAGHDLKEGQAERAHYNVEQRWEYEEERFLGYAVNIWNLSKPTIARVQGACIAGSFMVANMCDLLVAADDAYFADPVVHSMGAATVEVLVHPWVMGMRRAKEMLYTGEPFSAEEAYRIGLANRVVPRADLIEATQALAERIGQAPPFALKLTKRSLNQTADMQGFRNAIQAHFAAHELSHFTSEMGRTVNSGLAGAVGDGKRLLSRP